MDGRTDGRTDDAKTISLRLRRRIIRLIVFEKTILKVVFSFGCHGNQNLPWQPEFCMEWTIPVKFCDNPPSGIGRDVI